MKILSILNVSNRENTGSDSGVIFQRLLFTECIKDGHEVVVASPFEVEIENVQNVFYEPGRSKYDVRFRFDWDKNRELIESINPDIILCNQIEQCANFRALLVTLGLSTQIKLATYYHYLPVLEIRERTVVWDPSLNHEGLGELILLEVFGALKSADVFFVTSEYSRNSIFALADLYNISFDDDKIVIMPPPADTFFETQKTVRFDPAKRAVLYSSRLYEQYGTDFLLDIIKYYSSRDVKFIITDFFPNKSTERKKLDTKTELYREFLRYQRNVVVRSDGDMRIIYRDEILRSSSMVLGPYRKNANWSMGMIDAFMMGIPGIGPDFASFPEFIPPQLIYTDKASAIALIDRLLTDERFWNEASGICKTSYSAFLPRNVADLFLDAVL